LDCLCWYFPVYCAADLATVNTGVEHDANIATVNSGVEHDADLVTVNMMQILLSSSLSLPLSSSPILFLCHHLLLSPFIFLHLSSCLFLYIPYLFLSLPFSSFIFLSLPFSSFLFVILSSTLSSFLYLFLPISSSSSLGDRLGLCQSWFMPGIVSWGVDVWLQNTQG
jgi:hypothetical protein